MNLGSFAGGAVQSHQAGVRQNMAQQDQAHTQNMQQRRMVMAEQDHAAQQEQRQRQAQLREESAKLFNEFYGEREEKLAESTADDGNGGIARIPTVRKTVKAPGSDPTHDTQFQMRHAMLMAKFTQSPQDMKAAFDMVENGRKTEQGRALEKVLAGDESATAVFLKALGKNPEGAKLDRRPLDGVQQIVLANGEKVDLRGAMLRLGSAAQWKAMQEEEQGAQTAAYRAAQTRNLGASAALNEARAKAEPAESAALIRQRDASAAASRARAANVGAGGAGGAAKGAGKELQAAVKMVTEKGADMKADPASAAHILAVADHHLSSGKAKSPNQAASMAAAVVTKIRSEADRKIGELRRAGRKPAEFDGKNWDDVRNIAIQQRIAKQFGATPATATADDEGDDE